MLGEVKLSLRITHDVLDIDIADLIEEARRDLQASGISAEKANDDDDALIKRSIKTYCKANFGIDNPNAERFQESYNSQKNHLCLMKEYIEDTEVR